MRHVLARIKFHGQPTERELYHKLVMACNDAGMSVLGTARHDFYPQGLTVAVVLAESHVTIHTYPERGLIYFDAFTCGDADPGEILMVFARDVGGTVEHRQLIDRT